MNSVATEEERAAVDEVLGAPETSVDGVDGRVVRGGHEARERRHLLLPALHALQSRVGWVSPGGLSYVSQRLTVPPAEAYGVASFYALFSTEPRPATLLHVCDDIACRVAGAEALVEDVERALGAERADHVVRSPCLGQCDRAPAAFLQSAGEEASEISIGNVSVDSLAPFMRGGPWTIGGAETSIVAPQTKSPSTRATLRLLTRLGVVDPRSLDEYRMHGGYEALRRALDLGPEGLIRELKDAKLLGRGGAAFPTGVKWEAVARQPVRPHYFVCNADESEPGTFKDRVLMEQDPFALVEAMTIAGYATGCERGYIYLRGEYPQAHAILSAAIAEARSRGFLGSDVLGHGFAFEVEIRRGAGAYICGEETSIFNSIEGYRGEPRSKPPFPVSEGLFGMPTVVNNVETLVNVLEIVLFGGAAFASVGEGVSTGTRLFCLSGCVESPGVYEVPYGTKLGELLELAGAVCGGGPPPA